MKSLRLGLASLAFLGICAQAEDVVESAERQYTLTVERVEAEHLARTKTAREKLLTALKTAQSATAKAGDLDGALKIRDRIRMLESTNPTASQVVTQDAIRNLEAAEMAAIEAQTSAIPPLRSSAQAAENKDASLIAGRNPKNAALKVIVPEKPVAAWDTTYLKKLDEGMALTVFTKDLRLIECSFVRIKIDDSTRLVLKLKNEQQEYAVPVSRFYWVKSGGNLLYKDSANIPTDDATALATSKKKYGGKESDAPFGKEFGVRLHDAIENRIKNIPDEITKDVGK